MESYSVQVRCDGKLEGRSIGSLMKKYGIRIEKVFTVFRKDEHEQNICDTVLKEGDIIYFDDGSGNVDAVIADNYYGKTYR